MNIRILSLMCFVLLGFSACKKFEDFQIDPNRTTQATPDLVFSSVQQQAFNRISVGAAMASRQLVNVESVSSEQYYNWLRGSFNDYGNLRQVYKMNQEAERLGKTSYLPLAVFFKCWYLYDLTLTFGDIPYSEALQGDNQQFQPKYDTQQAVFLQMLNELDQANAMIAKDMEPVSGDLIYGGDLQQWKKVINTFTLKVLMTLSAKVNDPSLNVAARFAKIVNDPTTYPVFTDNSDNLSLPYYDIVNNRYPYYNNNGIQTANYMEKTFVDLLKGLKDPRLFRYAAPARALVNQYGAEDFRAYEGVLGSAPNNENAAQVVTGRVSNINSRYYNNPTNEPALGLGFSELQFLLAEAAVRGWIAGNAVAFYQAGIQASLAFAKVPETDINTYLAQESLQQLTPGNEIKEIVTQKYIASFMLPSWNAFYEQRRTGFPIFDVSGGAVLNNGKVPKRWMYPEDELRNNADNLAAAVSRQYPEGDHINGVMWLLQ